MKLTLSLFLALVLVFSGCKKSDGDDPPYVNPCPLVATTQLEISGGVNIRVSNGHFYGYCQIEYGPSGFSRGSGTMLDISDDEYIRNLADGPYDFYIRGTCGVNSWSDWSEGESFLVKGGSTCAKPTGLANNGKYNGKYNLVWLHTPLADYYEIEYGATGFNLGSGVRKAVNTEYYDYGGYASGVTYDFYVRANCGGSDWSPWAGPSSFYAQ